MLVVIFANGELPPTGEQAVVATAGSADVVIAVDGGLHHCARLGLRPHRLVGDLDSVAPHLVEGAERDGVVVERHPIDKDATDLELAIERAQQDGASQVVVAAAFGGRLDHELATIGLLASARWRDIAMSATDGRRQLWVVTSHLEIAAPVGQTVSLVPWADDVHGATTVGMQWPLDNDTLPLGTTRGVSNVAISPVQTVSCTDGTLLVVADEDQPPR